MFTDILKPEILEYIDDTFPWFDGYKPKYHEIIEILQVE